MTIAEYTRLVAQIAILKEVAMEYPAKKLRISSRRWKREERRLAIVPKNNKTIAYGRNVVSKGQVRLFISV